MRGSEYVKMYQGQKKGRRRHHPVGRQGRILCPKALSAPPPAGRLAAEVGYGLPASVGMRLVTSYVGTVLTDCSARTYRVPAAGSLV